MEKEKITEYAKYFDHTNLRAYATAADIKKLCEEASSYGFFSVCVNPYYTKVIKASFPELKVSTVIGFPLGSETSETKFYSAKKAFEDGADELDIVMNIGALKDKSYTKMLDELKEITKLKKILFADDKEKLVKIIIRASDLTNDEIAEACQVVANAGADYVKNGTGFEKDVATYPIIELMSKTIAEKKLNLLIKAAGGISTAEDFLKYIAIPHVKRIGASRSVQIIEELKQNII